MPCKIVTLEVVDVSDFTINYDAAQVPKHFQNFIQTPNCGYSLDYTLTLDEVEGGAEPKDFSLLVEGSVPDPTIVNFFPGSRLSLWYSEDPSQVFLSFYCYIKGRVVLPQSTVNAFIESGYDQLR